jgi:hypothetical protein
MTAKFKGMVGLVSSLALLCLTFALLRSQNVGTLLDAWKKLDTASILISVICVQGMLLASAWRLRIIMAAAGVGKVGLASLFRLQLIVQFVAHGAPISALADVAKVALLAMRFNLMARTAFRMVVYERILGAVALVCLGAAALGFQLEFSIPPHAFRIEAAVWAIGLTGIALLIGFSRLRILTGIALLDKVVRGIDSMGDFLLRPPFVASLLLSCAMQVAFMAVAFAVLASAMHLDYSFIQVLLFIPFIFFVTSLPIFYLGWGGREAAVMVTLGTTSIGSSEAVALSVAFGLCVLLGALPGGIFWLMRPTMRKAAIDEANRLKAADRDLAV